jgi:adenylate cyclase
MSEGLINRKLSAILSADVKGYSRLMRSDEEATVRTLTKYRSVITELVLRYQGRVVDSPGDNILAEFASVVHAVQCGFDTQALLQAENAKLSEDRRMEFRIGINLGDVIQEGKRIYGDGVNVAARMESLAEPGGICVSGSAYDQIENKFAFGCEYLGEQIVKNISTPIRVYRLIRDEAGQGCRIRTQVRKSSNRLIFAVVLGLLLFSVAGFMVWNSYKHQATGLIEAASIERMAFPLPDKPSIAVLPFTNMSGEADQEYFSDGITEHIITSLSKVPYIFVIARNSTFTYKNKFVKVQQIAEELGVRYVLEGSVQRSGDRVRITAQLIDATKGRQLWADNYDRKIDDLFVVQDDIAMKIMAALQVELSAAELGQLYSTNTTNIKAYEKYLESYEYFWRRTEGDSLQARKLAEEAISLDPGYGAPYVVQALTYLDDVWFYRTKSPTKSLQTAEQLIQKAIELSGNDASTHQALGMLYILSRDYDKAIAECQKAIELSPNSAESFHFYGLALRFAGRFDEAISNLKKAIRLNPVTPIYYLNVLAWAYLYDEQYEKAILLWKKILERNPDHLFSYLGLTAAYQLSGNETSARESAQEVLRLKSNMTISILEKGPATNNIDRRKRIFEAMRIAGIPE